MTFLERRGMFLLADRPNRLLALEGITPPLVSKENVATEYRVKPSKYTAFKSKAPTSKSTRVLSVLVLLGSA